MANGFGNRFLVACVRRSKQLPEGGQMSDEAWARLKERILGGDDFRPRGQCTAASRRELWFRVYGKRAGTIGAITDRAEALVMRLAVINALLDRSAEIGREHLEAALALWDDCDRSCQYLFGRALGDPVADHILALLHRSPAGVTRSEIRDGVERAYARARR